MTPTPMHVIPVVGGMAIAFGVLVAWLVRREERNAPIPDLVIEISVDVAAFNAGIAAVQRSMVLFGEAFVRVGVSFDQATRAMELWAEEVGRNAARSAERRRLRRMDEQGDTSSPPWPMSGNDVAGDVYDDYGASDDRGAEGDQIDALHFTNYRGALMFHGWAWSRPDADPISDMRRSLRAMNEHYELRYDGAARVSYEGEFEQTDPLLLDILLGHSGGPVQGERLLDREGHHQPVVGDDELQAWDDFIADLSSRPRKPRIVER